MFRTRASHPEIRGNQVPEAAETNLRWSERAAGGKLDAVSTVCGLRSACSMHAGLDNPRRFLYSPLLN
jgi:hypothetical protein